MPTQKKENYQDIQDKSSKGIKWVGIAEIFIRFFQYGTTIVLARILTPEDFGVIGIALIFTQLAYVLFDFGFSSALIQKKDIRETHYSTTFLIYLVSAALYIILVLLFAPAIAAFFELPVLGQILQTLTIIFLLYALNAMPRIRLQKEMRFKRFGSLQIISVFFYGVVTIGCALYGFGLWSFVCGIIAEQLVLTLLLNLFAWWKPHFTFDKAAFKELMNFGSNVLGTRVIAYLNANAPNFIIGKVLGASALGYYSIAYQLVEFPVQRISKNVLRVMFPAFSKLQDNHQDFRNLYGTTVYHLLLILMPVFVGLILIAPFLVELLYGEKWLPAVLPLQLLSAAGFFRSIWATTSVVFLSKGKPQIELKINMTFSLILIPVLIFASAFGLVEIAASVSLVTWIFLLIAQYKALNLIEMKWYNLIKAYFLPAIGVTSFTAIILVFNHFGLNGFTKLNQLIITIATSMLVYILLILKFDRNIVKKLVKFIGAR
ncbi:MAG: lipopolysaccharide biosynthesis protein [Calditrichaeota bacterium]|nr:MAG: lipopolysaccharide biosynthesis protein [Calditrichota bacterium]MBL1206320.1 lipopolysaccharide biosynthesis protein [Calditrichota bacterium]NOG46146.1 lipopolysaccharide biosynthesis protein [Calditrichota bacterium]